MAMRIRSSPLFQILVIVSVLAIPLLVVARIQDTPAPIAIRVNGQQEMVPATATFGQLLRARHLRAKDGRLLDVQGKTINAHADPGRVLLNGATAPRRRPLHAGDQIVVQNGKDTTETTVNNRTMLPGQQAGDPQFTLRTSRVQEITTQGKISGKIVSVRYRSVGKGSTPPQVALTFDDGPWPGTTKKVLAILKRFHVKATFFLIGDQIGRFPDLVRAEQKAGMTIANHTWDHPQPPANPSFDKLTPARMRNEMSKTTAAITKLNIPAPTLFRPPGGYTSPQVVSTAAQQGMREVLWDVDPRDWSPTATKKSIVSTVMHEVRPGSIIDMHDGGGDQSATVAALPDIIKGIRKKGLQLVALAPSA